MDIRFTIFIHNWKKEIETEFRRAQGRRSVPSITNGKY